MARPCEQVSAATAAWNGDKEEKDHTQRDGQHCLDPFHQHGQKQTDSDKEQLDQKEADIG